jgi:hypothetical protein
LSWPSGPASRARSTRCRPSCSVYSKSSSPKRLT